MIIGTGLVSRSFHRLPDQTNVLICASGVSNSQTTDTRAYAREEKLVASFRDTPSMFVYFSTVSVLYPCLHDSAYVRFKLRMEEYIARNFRRYMIFRLPNLVGNTRNPHTLTNFLFQKISAGNPFHVHAYATRYLLDADDMASICTWYMQHKPQNSVFNIVLDNKIGVRDIVVMFESILHAQAEYEILNKGCDASIAPVPTEILDTIGLTSYKREAYNRMLLEKYYTGE